MMTFVVIFVDAARDSSISETDLRGKESGVVFSDFQAEKGGVR
jgi:hypothetical protein